METVDVLKEVFETSKKEDIVSEGLFQGLKKMLGEGYEKTEKFSVIRASQAYRLCAREAVYTHLIPEAPPILVKNQMSMRLRMDVGTFLHWYLQNLVFGPLGILYGLWRKWDRSWTSEMGFRPEGRVPSDMADVEAWQFVESVVGLPEINVVGHADGLICLNRLQKFMETKEIVPHDFEAPLNLVLLEIKTTDDNVIRLLKDKGLAYLDESYKCQATLYQKALLKDKTIFVYIDRKYFSVVTLTYKGEDKYLDLVQNKWNQIKTAESTKKLPDRCVDCVHSGSKRAKECPYVEFCFESDPDLIFSVAGA